MQGPLPDRVGLPLDRPQTPFLSLDRPSFVHWANRTFASLHKESLGWWPTIPIAPCPAVYQQLQQAGATGVACTRLNSAERLAQAGLPRILLTLPPVGTVLSHGVARLATRCELLVVVDHYFHAQALSAAAQKSGAPLRVLIEVNVGRDELGVRAGHDAVRLGQGIARLPGLRLQGLFGRAADTLDPGTTSDSPLTPLSAVLASQVVLEHCATLFRSAGLPCERVFCTAPNNTDPTSGQHVSTDLVTTGFTSDNLPTTETPAEVPPSQQQPFRLTSPVHSTWPPVCLWATVLSRSQLERAVIDVGHTCLGTSLTPGIGVRNWPDAKLTCIGTDYSTLTLGPLSQRLRIGDRVALVGLESLAGVRPAPGCVVTEGSRILDVWPWDLP